MLKTATGYAAASRWLIHHPGSQIRGPGGGNFSSLFSHSLLGITNRRDLEYHPKVGASWEGYAVEEVLKSFRPDEAYYWATYNGAELDLFLFKNGRRIGIECKRADAPALTPSMRTALADLRLDHLYVLYPGDKTYALGRKVEVMPLAKFVKAK